MSRTTKSIAESARQKDWFAVAILAVVVLISGWVVSLLVLQHPRKLAIERFQLASPSWTSWAMLAPVPSMYNFENRIRFVNELDSDGPLNRQHESWFECRVNHYPARCVTFGEFSPTWFAEKKEGTFEMSTRFREDELISRWLIVSQEDGTMRVQRESENWVRHDADE